MGLGNNQGRGVFAHEVVGPFNLPAETVGTSARDQPTMRPSPGGSHAFNAILAEAARLEALRHTGTGSNGAGPGIEKPGESDPDRGNFDAMSAGASAKSVGGCGCGPKSNVEPLSADMKADILARLREVGRE